MLQFRISCQEIKGGICQHYDRNYLRHHIERFVGKLIDLPFGVIEALLSGTTAMRSCSIKLVMRMSDC